mgnify:CR=1 FL=1
MLKLHIKHLSSDDLHVQFTVTRSIIVPEIDALPSPQQHPSFRHNARFADTCLSGFDVGAGIPLDMSVASLIPKRVRIAPIHVLLHIRIRVLVDR